MIGGPWIIDNRKPATLSDFGEASYKWSATDDNSLFHLLSEAETNV
jgi:hypothetical protein